jgi:PAS domain S-box-containing protein
MIADLLLQRRRRRRAEAGLLESRQFMELATEAGGIGLWVRDVVRGDLWANARMRSLLGFGQQDALGIDDVLARVHPDDRAQVMAVVERAQETGMPFEVEFRTAELPAAPERWIAARGQFMRGPRGRVLRRMGTMIDITERKAAEKRLRESEDNFRRLVESTAAVIWQADMDSWMFTYVGPQAVKLLGHPLEQWYEKDFWVSHIHPEDREAAVDTCLTMSKSAQEFNFEYRMITASGEIVWVHDFVNCQHQDGKPTHLRGLMLDITERKRAEERFRIAVEASPHAIVMSDDQGRIALVNAQAEKLFGYSREELLGQSVEILVPERFRTSHPAYRAGFLAAPQARPMGAGRELFGLRKDGSEFPVEIGLSPIHTPEGLITLTTVIDITERKRAAEALEKERSFLRQVIDIDPNFIFAKDREGRFTLANQAVADAYGTTVDRLIGKTDADFNPNREEVELFHRMDLEVIDTLQERFIPEEHVTDARGNVRWVQTVKRPIIESDGSARQVLGASTDITRRRETELQLKEQRAELAHVARISTMGELAASLAHELNQPLTAILSNAQAALRFLNRRPVDLEEVREILQDIVKDNSRAGEVIRRMRALVRKEELEFAPVDVASLIRDVVVLVHSDAILQNVKIALQLDDNLPPVRGDKVQLQQVVLNLLLNAFDAMGECLASEREVGLRAERENAGMILVAVSDRGTGLSGDKLDKIFQPFFTTKGEGLGMGLSICRSIIEAHGGRLWAENNPHRGATFYFTVPVEGAAGGSDQ